MRKKVWLSRDGCNYYCLTPFKPKFINGTIFAGTNSGLIIKNLCPKLVEKWFGLKRPFKIGEYIQGYFNVSFKPIRGKK